MLDITKCDGIDCPSRDKCYRYVAKPERYQSYAAFYEGLKNGKCENYWEVDDGYERDSTGITETI